MPTDVQATGERRMFERFSARFPVKFKDAREDYGTNVLLQNASAGGMRISTKERFFLDDQLSLEVELPDGGEPMILSGHVVWVRLLNLALWDTGIQFNEVNFFRMQRLFKLAETSAL